MQQKFLEFIVDDQFIRAPHYTVVADSRDYLKARFSFSEHWRELTKTAVFQGADGKAYFVVLDKDICLIPWEVIQPTQFLVSVFGGDRLTADRAVVEVAASGFTANGVTPPAPTPDVYNQLTETVSLERQIAENAATTATEKAEQCVTLVSTAESLLQDVDEAKELIHAAIEAEQRAAVHAATAQLKADEAKAFFLQTEESRERAESHAVYAGEQAGEALSYSDAANRHATAAYTFAEEARASAEEAKKVQASMSRQLLATVTIDEPVSRVDITFDKPIKEFYLIFKGTVTTDTDVSDCIFACRTNGGSQYFFYNGSLKMYSDKNQVYVAHAREMVERFWETAFTSVSLNATLQGLSGNTCATKVSFSQRNTNIPRFVESLQFFVYNDKYTLATGSTIEVWGIPAE